MSLRVVSERRLLSSPGMGVFLKTGQAYMRTLVSKELTSGSRPSSPKTSPTARAK